jgi:hypothetical protein
MRGIEFAEQPIHHPLELIGRSARSREFAVLRREFLPVESLLGWIEIEAFAQNSSSLVEEREIPFATIELDPLRQLQRLHRAAGRWHRPSLTAGDERKRRSVERNALQIGGGAELLEIAAIPVDRVEASPFARSARSREHEAIA